MEKATLEEIICEITEIIRNYMLNKSEKIWGGF